MKKKKKQLDPTIAAVKAARKKSREEEFAKYGKQISLYYWVGDKKKHARGGKHKKRWCWMQDYKAQWAMEGCHNVTALKKLIVHKIRTIK